MKRSGILLNVGSRVVLLLRNKPYSENVMLFVQTNFNSSSSSSNNNSNNNNHNNNKPDRNKMIVAYKNEENCSYGRNNDDTLKYEIDKKFETTLKSDLKNRIYEKNIDLSQIVIDYMKFSIIDNKIKYTCDRHTIIQHILHKRFLERIMIPRGMCKTGENKLLCALREFIEETNICPIGTIYIEQEPFNLWWYDDKQFWQYDIYKVYSSQMIPFHNKFKLEIDSFSDKIHVNLCQNYSSPDKLIPYDKHQYREKVIIIHWKMYKFLMKRFFLKYYTCSNYNEFLNSIFSKKIFSKKFFKFNILIQ